MLRGLRLASWPDPCGSQDHRRGRGVAGNGLAQHRRPMCQIDRVCTWQQAGAGHHPADESPITSIRTRIKACRGIDDPHREKRCIEAGGRIAQGPAGNPYHRYRDPYPAGLRAGPVTGGFELPGIYFRQRRDFRPDPAGFARSPSAVEVHHQSTLVDRDGRLGRHANLLISWRPADGTAGRPVPLP